MIDIFRNENVLFIIQLVKKALIKQREFTTIIKLDSYPNGLNNPDDICMTKNN